MESNQEEPTKRPVGRPPGSPVLLTPETQKAICTALESGVAEKYAAEANDVDEMTFHGWMRKGAEGIEPYAEFRKVVTRARARAVLNMHAIALDGGKVDKEGKRIKRSVAAALWFLERRFHKEYASRQRIEHTSTDSLANMSDEELIEERDKQRQRIAAFERIRQGQSVPGDSSENETEES